MIDCDFELRRGPFRLTAKLQSDVQVTGLFGPSGYGKTSILHAVAGILTPQSGRIAVGGRTFWEAGGRTHLPPERRRVGVVFQENLLFPHLRVRDNLLFGYRRTPPGRRRLELEEVAGLLGLAPLLDSRTDALSGGEARRVAIGRALLTSPDLLILDEPLVGLDRRLRDRILAYLIRLKDQLDLRIVYVSHSFSDLAALADRMAVLDAQASPDGVRRSRIARFDAPRDLFRHVADHTGVGPLETVIRGELTASDPALGYATVRAEGLEMHVPLERDPGGTKAFVTLRADEVILSVGEVPRISTRNIWTGTVAHIHRLEARTVVEVDVGQRILAEVTEDAVRDLGLAAGARVHALAKARSLRVTALP